MNNAYTYNVAKELPVLDITPGHWLTVGVENFRPTAIRLINLSQYDVSYLNPSSEDNLVEIVLWWGWRHLTTLRFNCSTAEAASSIYESVCRLLEDYVLRSYNPLPFTGK